MGRQRVKMRSMGCRRACAQRAFLVLTLLGVSSAASRGEIPWRNNAPVGGTAQVASGLSAAPDVATTIQDLASRDGARHAVVQFSAPVDDATRARLKASGMTLLNYLGNNAYFTSVADRGRLNASSIAATGTLGDVVPVQRQWKLDPRITAGTIPHWASVARDSAAGALVGLYVLFHGDVSLDIEGANAVTRHGGVVRDTLESINALVIELPLASVNGLADEDVVQWIEWPLPPMQESNDSNRAITQADAVQSAPYNLDGSGVTVLVYDGGTARNTHVDFQGRLTNHDTSPVSDHSTHVAGTIGGAGVANPAFAGMAPGTSLLSYGFQSDGTGIFLYTNPGDLEADYNDAINVRGADIANNSIGTNTETNGFPCSIQGDYGVTAALIDAIVGGSLGAPFRVLWANGNERQGTTCNVEGFGEYYSTAPPSGAKNHITIGALNADNDTMTTFSSWGPLDDGRLKPDVSAPGCQSNGDFGVTSCSSTSDTAYTVKCGTSMATPTVTGLAALLLEDYRAQFPGAGDFRNATLKTLLAHNAQDVLNIGPDYQSGYGSVRIQDTIDFMRSGEFVEHQVVQGDVFSVLVTVNPGDAEFKVTLAWDDVPGTPNVSPALVNDLDLRVFDPSSVQVFPWTLDPSNPSAGAVQTQADHINNIEQVFVAAPAAGIWRVEVFGFNVPSGPQSFSLAASPNMLFCSQQGTVALDAALLGCSSTAGIQVIDCDLNTDGAVAESVTVTIASTSEPGGESVVLLETGPDTAEFRGSIPLNETNAAGVLQVAHSDTVTATYLDANDGLGGSNVAVNAAATVNCVGPTISSVQSTNLGADSATVMFTTDVPATGTVRFGTSCGSLTGSQSEAAATTAHSLNLTGLTMDTLYFYVVDAVDQQNNTTTNDNAGGCFTLKTLAVAFDFTMDTDPGWTTEGQWAYGQPVGFGGQHGGPDPVGGFTGNNAYGYNLLGDYANNLPETHLTSTALDCTGLVNVKLRFWRWLGVEQPAFDHAYVRISTDGVLWTTIWQNPSQITDSVWVLQEFDISAIADNQPSLFLRWTMGTTDFTWQYCGWNLDDIQIIGLSTIVETCSDGLQNQGEDRIDCGGPCAACQCTTDAACDNALFCDGVESCDAFGTCQIGTAPDCADAVACTVDSCNEGSDSCDHIANNALCSNAVFCDGAEICDTLSGCQPGAAPCGADCEHCNESAATCDWCVFDLDASGIMGTGDFSLFAACFGGCFAPGDACLASDFDQVDGCVGTGDYAAFAGCFGLACGDCPNCIGPNGGGGAGGGASASTTADVSGPPVASIQLVATTQPSLLDRTGQLPVSMGSAKVGRPFYIEAWARSDNTDPAAEGLGAVYMDILLSRPSLMVERIVPGSLYSALATGVVEQNRGVVRAMGGCMSPGQTGMDTATDWIRIASLRVRAMKPGPVDFATAPANQPYGIAVFNSFGNLDPARIDFGALSVTIQPIDDVRSGLRKGAARRAEQAADPRP